MKDKIFLDTNFLVYLQNSNEPEKQKHCRALIKHLASKSTIVLSTQVIQEFYVVMTRKMGADPVLVKGLLQLFRQFEIVTIDLESISQAIDFSIIHQLSFWDALIVSAAQKANCSTLFTEDLNSGQIMAGIKIINPFTISVP
ncbi:MAG: PIN domain-containing protein [Saprospiraceae bacterium]|nr:PIN domain-containing protein [Saprospiraceae bacterium]